MASANDIVRIARTELGNKEHPPGSNNVKYNTAYYGRAVSGSAYPWCCAFIWWVFRQAGASNLFNGGNPTAYCPTAMNWYVANKQFHKSGFLPGDVIFFDFSGRKSLAGHIGIVERVNSDGSVVCLEGNTSVTSNDNGGAVMQRTRYMSSIMGVGRPAYSGTDTVATDSGGVTPQQASSTPITEETDASTVGEAGTVRQLFKEIGDNGVTLLIQHNDEVFEPVVTDSITLESARVGTPEKLVFKIVKDEKIGQLGGFLEGDAVKLVVNGRTLFFGFVFTKTRTTETEVTVTAYSQLRYLKNKDTIAYKGLTATELIRQIAGNYNLNLGTIEDTGVKIESRLEEDQTLFDIILNALDVTLLAEKKLYVLYDDGGFLTLKNLDNMKLDLLIDEETGESYDYKSSIDTETYNRIKLTYNNEETGRREVYIAQNGAHQNEWGILQYKESLNSSTGIIDRANNLLEFYDQKTRNLTIKNALGDIRIRGGNAVIVKLNLGDLITSNYMVVQKVKHTFKNGEHFMDLTLIGGEFVD